MLRALWADLAHTWRVAATEAISVPPQAPPQPLPPPPLCAPDPPRIQHEIYTDVSFEGAFSTFAGVLNPTVDGKAEAAFVFTADHASTPLSVGKLSISIPPRITPLTGSYARCFALDLWKERVRGGHVVCFTDTQTMLDPSEIEWRGSWRSKDRTKVVQKRISALESVIQDITDEYEVEVRYQGVQAEENQVARRLCQLDTPHKRLAGLPPQLREQVEAADERIAGMGMWGLVMPQTVVPEQVGRANEARESQRVWITCGTAGKSYLHTPTVILLSDLLKRIPPIFGSASRGINAIMRPRTFSPKSIWADIIRTWHTAAAQAITPTAEAPLRIVPHPSQQLALPDTLTPSLTLRPSPTPVPPSSPRKSALRPAKAIVSTSPVPKLPPPPAKLGPEAKPTAKAQARAIAKARRAEALRLTMLERRAAKGSKTAIAALKALGQSVARPPFPAGTASSPITSPQSAAKSISIPASKAVADPSAPVPESPKSAAAPKTATKGRKAKAAVVAQKTKSGASKSKANASVPGRDAKAIPDLAETPSEVPAAPVGTDAKPVPISAKTVISSVKHGGMVPTAPPPKGRKPKSKIPPRAPSSSTKVATISPAIPPLVDALDSSFPSDVVGPASVLPATLSDSAPERIHYEIQTDMSARDGLTTFAGIFRIHGGAVLDAFSFTLNHATVPLQIGQLSCLVSPTDTNWTEAYAVLFALEQWAGRAAGARLTCSIDSSSAATAAATRGDRSFGPKSISSAYGGAITHLVEKHDILIEHRHIPRAFNTEADTLSQSRSYENRVNKLHAWMRGLLEAADERIGQMNLAGYVPVAKEAKPTLLSGKGSKTKSASMPPPPVHIPFHPDPTLHHGSRTSADPV